MRTVKEIVKDIRDTKREMRANGVPVSSCFNGGHSPESYRYNAKLFALSVEKADAEKREAIATTSGEPK